MYLQVLAHERIFLTPRRITDNFSSILILIIEKLFKNSNFTCFRFFCIRVIWIRNKYLAEIPTKISFWLRLFFFFWPNTKNIRNLLRIACVNNIYWLTKTSCLEVSHLTFIPQIYTGRAVLLPFKVNIERRFENGSYMKVLEFLELTVFP